METINNILNTFETFRMAPTPLDQYEQKGKAHLAETIAGYVGRNRPIEFAMLGFPFKSTNTRDKVIGRLPDLGEELTLLNFRRFDDEIKKVYEPGVRIDIISDGFIFNDLLKIPDREVLEYKEGSVELAKIAPVKFFDLNDFYKNGTLADKREKAVEQFGITPEKLEAEILTNPDVNFLYRGMIHFMREELATQTFPSNHQAQVAAKKLTRSVMFRNEAYSNLVRKEFSQSIRLSMHPSVNSGEKYSFKLIPGNTPHSAWHCAIVVDGAGAVSTMHRKDAEAAGAVMQQKDGRNYYFTLNQVK